jgi:serine/threonine protein kinase/AraC-like DNA-binding protein/tetratricopeptide (TPR) repeat protein
MDINGKIVHNKYQIDQLIGEDAISYLHLAHDLSNPKVQYIFKFLKNNVISKRIEDIIRFRIDANAVSEIDHPNIIKIIEVGELIELLFIAMEYFPGTSLQDIINERYLPIRQSVDIIVKISRALEALHANNIIHRDLKPANILIDNETVKLAGFGLSHLREFNDTVTFNDIVWNFAYISPEQCGILKRSIDERSDLYSLGILFFELLTGMAPFEGPDICSIIHQHIAMVPELPSILNPETPPILDRIVLKLLEKEPENRYQSARGLLADLERYLSGQQEFILGLDDRFTKLSYRTKLIGREREMQQLLTAADRLREKSGAVYFITGNGGTGKTRLIDELKSSIYACGSLMVEGKCSIQSNKVPNKPIQEALDAFLTNFHSLSESQKNNIIIPIREEFHNLGELIIKLNPSMKELLGECPPLVALEPEREYKRFHMIICQFILKLSDLVNGLVIVLENLQWTDEGTLNILSELMNEITCHPLVIIGVYRDDEVTEDHSLEKLHMEIAGREVPLTRIHLEQFDAATMNKFVAGLLLEPEEQIIGISDFIIQKSGGNPFFTIEILKQLIEDGVLMYKNNRWRFDESKLGSIEISASSVEVILKRINKLNKNEKEILSGASVMGEKFNMQLLFRLSELDRTEIVRIIDKAIDLQLLVDLPTWGEIGFAHDRIKEAFYNNIRKDKKKKLHLAIANAIEENNKDDLLPVIFDLAHHFIEAEDTDRAIIFAFPAGTMAMKRYANEEALNYFKLALKMLEEKGLGKNEQWIRILVNMSKVYLTVGKYDQAIQMLLEVAPLIKNIFQRADIYSNISAAYFRKGDWNKCEDYAIQSGTLLGEHFPDNRVVIIASIVKELIQMLINLIFPGVLIRFRREKTIENNKLRAKFALPVLRTYIYANTLKFTRLTLRAHNVAISKIGKSVELGMAISGLSNILMAMTRFNLSLRYHKKALALKESLNDQWGAAQSYQWLGYCHLWSGKYRKSIECFDESARRFKSMGDMHETGNSCSSLIHNYLLIADYTSLRNILDQYFTIANDTNDFFGINLGWILSTPFFLETGDIETAESLGIAAYNFSQDSKIMFTHCWSCIELGRVYLEKREIRRSLEYLEKALAIFKENKFLKHYTVHLFPLLAEAYLADYLFNTDIGRPEKKQLLAKTGEFCKKSLSATKRWTSHYGLALLVNAKYCAVLGKKKRAMKLFLASIDHNKKIGRRFCLGRSYYEYGLYLSQADAGIAAKKTLEMAYRVFLGIGAERYIKELKNLLGITEDSDELTTIERRIDNERLTSIIQLARDISQLTDTEQLMERILFKAVEITGAQRGCIFIANENDELEKKAVFSTLGYDMAIDHNVMHIMREVYATRSQKILGDAGEHRTMTGYDDARVNPKSILCVPINERDRTIGVCYLDNSLTSGIFAEKEADLLLTFLSHVAFATEIDFLHRRYQSPRPQDRKPPQSPMITEKIQKAMDYIHENYAYEISREGLASHIGLHHDNLGRYFKLYHGKKMNDYINELRIKEAARKLQESDEKIIDIAFSVGFGSLRTFNKAFREIMKISPAYYRKNRPK